MVLFLVLQFFPADLFLIGVYVALLFFSLLYGLLSLPRLQILNKTFWTRISPGRTSPEVPRLSCLLLSIISCTTQEPLLPWLANNSPKVSPALFASPKLSSHSTGRECKMAGDARGDMPAYMRVWISSPVYEPGLHVHRMYSVSICLLVYLSIKKSSAVSFGG